MLLSENPQMWPKLGTRTDQVRPIKVGIEVKLWGVSAEGI